MIRNVKKGSDIALLLNCSQQECYIYFVEFLVFFPFLCVCSIVDFIVKVFFRMQRSRLFKGSRNKNFPHPENDFYCDNKESLSTQVFL